MRKLFEIVVVLVFWCGAAWAAGPDVAGTLSAGEDPCFVKARRGAVMTVDSAMEAKEAFRTEWWYVTGNLEDQKGRRYGYQFTIFRRGLSCEGESHGRSWNARHLYFAHMAVSRESDETFHSGYRMERQSFGLAGWKKEGGVSVWVDDVAFAWKNRKIHLSSQHGSPVFDLVLSPIKPAILQGDGGYSIKDPVTGSASHYLTLPRLQTSGALTLSGETLNVNGLSWLDREWSTGSLSNDQAGWDWMALHLSDGRDLMVCRVRGKKASGHFYFGSLSQADGGVVIFKPDDFTMTSQGTFDGPSGASYPARWQIEAPKEGISLEVVPLFSNQEHEDGVVYWEGAVVAKGGKGRGYLEMTGY